MSNEKILIVDDEKRMRILLRDFLSKEGYVILEAENGEQAMDLFYRQKELALILLDVMMPVMDGWETLREIRMNNKEIPVVMLTARSEERDELKGFELGVDEYISKPFSPQILVARINALLRRNKREDVSEIIQAKAITLDVTAHEVFVNEKPVDLSAREFELLHYFMKNPNVALNRERILSQVWDFDYFGDARTIDTHVKNLRYKLGDAGSMIKTVWGTGYKFEVSE